MYDLARLTVKSEEALNHMAKPPLSISQEEQDGICILTITGAVDEETFAEFKSTLHPIQRGEIKKFILDCTGVTYLNSQGIGLLAGLHRQTIIEEGHAALCGLSPRLTKTLDLVGLGARLQIFKTRAEALSALQQASGDSSS